MKKKNGWRVKMRIGCGKKKYYNKKKGTCRGGICAFLF